MGFERSKHDSCVYVKWRNGEAIAFLLLYVDDMLVASKSKTEISLIKKDLQASFEMKDLGAAKRILEMDIQRDREKGALG